MPHAGLMRESEMGPLEGPLMRARLHIRGGRRRLRQGKVAAGIVTLYDALSASLEWYCADAHRRAHLGIDERAAFRDEKDVYSALVSAGVIDGTFDYDRFMSTVERATREEMPEFDYAPLLSDFERLMTALHVMPFDEMALPPEAPSTF